MHGKQKRIKKGSGDFLSLLLLLNLNINKLIFSLLSAYSTHSTHSTQTHSIIHFRNNV